MFAQAYERLFLKLSVVHDSTSSFQLKLQGMNDVRKFWAGVEICLLHVDTVILFLKYSVRPGSVPPEILCKLESNRYRRTS